MNRVDPRALRNAFGSYMTGVTVVTARTNDGEPVGFTANSFTSVSLDPPLLLVCPGNHLSSSRVFRETMHFAVNVLAERQEVVSNVFAGPKGDRFAQVQWREDANGCPIIAGVVAHFSCSVHNRIEAGDHQILVGQILDFACGRGRALGYYAGGYFSLGNERQSESSALPGRKVVAGAIVESEGCVLAATDDQSIGLPSVRLGTETGARSAICQHFASLGLRVDIGRVYSVFDDSTTGEHYIYFRAKLADASMPPSFVSLPINSLGDLAWSTSAQARMMSRFAQEYRNNAFGLYVGDSQSGEVHADGPDIV